MLARRSSIGNRILRGKVGAYCTFLAVLLCGTFHSVFATSQFLPNTKPSVAVTRSGEKVDIDGKLDEAFWTQAGRAGNFCERYPGDKTEPLVRTEAFMAYGRDNLYVAFVCYDDPASVRATMCQRDQFSGDDAVCLLLDTYGEASWAYELFVNPYGIQMDHLWSGVGTGGDDPTFDLVWESAARITDSGYQVEMAIPFASLRFPNQPTQSWRVDFWRIHPRESYRQYSWVGYDRNEQCWPCQWGTLEGIEGVQPGKGIEIMPTMIAYQSGRLADPRNQKGPFSNADPDGEFSLGAKYSLASDVTAEAALNPDFSQIEADAAQIDVNSTIALMYPERRPFFQEGSDIFRTLFNSFYTRMINDPQFTGKLTARTSRVTLGFLTARDENTPYMIPLEEASLLVNAGRSFANVLRAFRPLGSGSYLGLFAADRRIEGGSSNSILSLDGGIRLSKNYSVDGQWILSHSAEEDDSTMLTRYRHITFDNGRHTLGFDGESYYGTALITRLLRSARSWNFIIDYNQVNPTYRTEAGYDPYSNYRNFSINSYYAIYPQRSLFQQITPGCYTLTRWNFDGTKKLELLYMGLDMNARVAQGYMGLGFSRTAEKYAGIQFDDLWETSINLGVRPTSWLFLSGDAHHGRSIARFAFVKGKETNLSWSARLKPVDRVTIEPRMDYTRSENANTDEELYEGYIARTRLQYQFDRQLSLRLVVQYDDFDRRWEIDPLLTYRLSPFSVAYLGSTYDYDELRLQDGSPRSWKLTSRQFFLKLQYLFQS